MRLAAGHAGDLYRSPDTLAVIRGREGRKEKERVGNSRREERWEMKGYTEGKEGENRNGKGE